MNKQGLKSKTSSMQRVVIAIIIGITLVVAGAYLYSNSQ